jgi:hypothetical protein
MVALTQDRRTPQRAGDVLDGPVAAGETIYAGAIVMRDAAGNLVRGKAATGLTGVGRAEERVDNAGGAAGAKTLRVERGIFAYENSAAADAITAADIGAACWAVDDQTVARTNGGGSRSKAGIVTRVDQHGVWVRFDEALTRAT